MLPAWDLFCFYSCLCAIGATCPLLLSGVSLPNYSRRFHGAFLRLLFQVFPTEGYALLYSAASAAVAAGKAPLHPATYPVMANQYHAIPGGWNVSCLCFVSRNCWLTCWNNLLAAAGMGRIVV